MPANNLPRNMFVVELDNEDPVGYEDDNIPAGSGLALKSYLEGQLVRLCGTGDLREGHAGKIGAHGLILLFEISYGRPIIREAMPSMAFIDDFNKNVPG